MDPMTTTTAPLLSRLLDATPDPDLVGESEYRAVKEVVSDLLGSLDTDEQDNAEFIAGVLDNVAQATYEFQKALVEFVPPAQPGARRTMVEVSVRDMLGYTDAHDEFVDLLLDRACENLGIEDTFDWTVVGPYNAVGLVRENVLAFDVTVGQD